MPNPTTIRLMPGGFVGPGYVLSAVDCAGAARCIAVGGAADGSLSSYASFAVSWNGRTWKTLRTGKVDALMGVSCSSARYCLTTGTWLGPADQTQILAESWNGKTMRVVARHGLYGVLSAVSCVSSSFCMAAGEGRDIDKWNGKRWTRSHTGPLPLRSVVAISGISCASTHMCVARAGDSYIIQSASEVWNGRKWRFNAFAYPPKGYDSSLAVRSVSCPGDLALQDWRAKPPTRPPSAWPSGTGSADPRRAARSPRSGMAAAGGSSSHRPAARTSASTPCHASPAPIAW